ncbi:MAG TPA: hypothetical protein VNU19_04880 [Candidatus Acidoferrum sp.]|jgi:hypothetical protein|nr:hypothetical protein [Candidatus Acidoferrum sp.]
MNQLPPDFAKDLARVIEPGKESAVAKIISTAALLNDEELRIFLEQFATRVRASPKRVTPQELAQLLREVIEGGQSSAT